MSHESFESTLLQRSNRSTRSESWFSESFGEQRYTRSMWIVGLNWTRLPSKRDALYHVEYHLQSSKIKPRYISSTGDCRYLKMLNFQTKQTVKQQYTNFSVPKVNMSLLSHTMMLSLHIWSSLNQLAFVFGWKTNGDERDDVHVCVVKLDKRTLLTVVIIWV